MKKSSLNKSVYFRMKLNPPVLFNPTWRNVSEVGENEWADLSDDDWLVDSVDQNKALRLVNHRIGLNLPLPYDHIYDFSSTIDNYPDQVKRGTLWLKPGRQIRMTYQEIKSTEAKRH